MEKHTYNIITRDELRKELLFYNKADICSSLVLLGVVSVFCIPLTLFLVFGVSMPFESVLFNTVFSVIIGLISSSPIWLMLYVLVSALIERKRLTCDEFDVVTRELSYKSDQLVRRGRHMHVEELLHFSDFKPTSVDHTAFQLASAGDVYYIVHYKGKDEIKLLYSTKMYKLQ